MGISKKKPKDANPMPPTESTDESNEDKLFRTDRWLETRTENVAQDLNHLEEFLRSAIESGRSASQAFSPEKELERSNQQIDRLETMESEAWGWTTRILGEESGLNRAEKWAEWYEEMQLKIRQIRNKFWRSNSGTADSTTAAPQPGLWTHRGGHVEKVKLPKFHGDIENYSEFKSQFRLLCQGEGYPPVIELAQLRTKIPDDAVQALIGQTDPDKAWERLDEMYGDEEMSVVTAMRRLRSFKGKMTTPHEQVIELVIEVQRCHAVLEGLGKVDVLYSDRETIAVVIQCLPQDSRDRWYH